MISAQSKSIVCYACQPVAFLGYFGPYNHMDIIRKISRLKPTFKLGISYSIPIRSSVVIKQLCASHSSGCPWRCKYYYHLMSEANSTLLPNSIYSATWFVCLIRLRLPGEIEPCLAYSDRMLYASFLILTFRKLHVDETIRILISVLGEIHGRLFYTVSAFLLPGMDTILQQLRIFTDKTPIYTFMKSSGNEFSSFQSQYFSSQQQVPNTLH